IINDSLSPILERLFESLIMSLTTLSMVEKEKLLILDQILVKDIINDSKSLSKIGLSENRIRNVLKEASQICNFI
ncbi:MAG TPA: hypothetical protein VJ765_05275, partial [Chitinophagaceae bacterium]|nr:hypothetical protein [Chitinophagaceae bacterium]